MVEPSGPYDEIYCIQQVEGGLGTSYRISHLLRRIHDVQVRGGPLVRCVRYKGKWQPVHFPRELLPALREMKAKQGDGKWPDYKWRSFRPRKDEKLNFIMDWEQPAGIYPSYG